MRPGLSSSGSGGFCALFFGHVHRGLDLPIWRKRTCNTRRFLWFLCGVRFFFLGLTICDTNLATSFTNIKNSKMRSLSMNSRNTSLNDLFSHGFFCSAFFFWQIWLSWSLASNSKASVKKSQHLEFYISEANRFGPNLVHQLGPSFQL